MTKYWALSAITALILSGCGGEDVGNKPEEPSTGVELNQPQVGEVYAMDKLNVNLGTATFDNGFELNATWGLGSGAYHYKGDAADEVYVLTDRGVNIKCKDSEEITGEKICDSGKIFPFPSFTPSIVKLKVDAAANTATVQEVIALKDKSGKNISGISNPLSNFAEEAYDIHGNPMQKDANGLDSEAMVKLSDGSFWLSDEYAPSLVHANAKGKIIKRLVPAGLEDELSAATYKVEGKLPAILAKRHANRGIESIAVSEDEKYLFFAMQSPLDNPDYADTNKVRLYKMEIENPQNIQEYLYELDAPGSFLKDNESKTRKQKDVKVSEMVAIEGDKLLVLERISKTTKLYKIDLSVESALDAKYLDASQTPTLEEETSLNPIAKHKIFDTDLEEGYAKKLEGVAYLGNNQFFMINDNDFGIEGDDTSAYVSEIDVNGSVDTKQTIGKVVFFDTDGAFLKEVKAGILPDVVKFTHDGSKVIVGNEGEVVGNEDLEAPLYDPYGSVSIVDATSYEVKHIDFKSVTTAPEGSKIRKGAEIARDFEPEYIAVSDDDKTAWISLQESNAIAKINLESDALESVFGLGFKDLSVTENAMDYKKNAVLEIETLPSGVFGMYQPDTIVAYSVAGKNYIVTANEGDDRDDFYAEATKASKLAHTAIGDLGDLRVNPDLGDADEDGEYEALYTYGARSFSIFDGDTGALVYDSANEMATEVASRFPAYFNTRPKKGIWRDLDERSEKKGIEPEALTLATISGETYAYIGLEKQGGFFVYNITDPQNPYMVEYNNDIDYTATIPYDKEDEVHVAPAGIDDMAPEGSVTFTQDAKNYYVVANEVSGTVSIYELDVDGKASKKGTYETGIYYDSAAEIVDYDPASKRLYVTSAAFTSVEVIDISDVTTPVKYKSIDLKPYGTGVNSVSVKNGKVAVAVEIKE